MIERAVRNGQPYFIVKINIDKFDKILYNS